MGAYLCRTCRSVVATQRSYCPACGKTNTLTYSENAVLNTAPKKPRFTDLRQRSPFGFGSAFGRGFGSGHGGFDDVLSRRERMEMQGGMGGPFPPSAFGEDELDDFGGEDVRRPRKQEKIVTFGSVQTPNYQRVSTGFDAFDMLLGDTGSPNAGAACGTAILLSGAAGLGKSTLLTQIVCHISGKKFGGKTCVYASSEETSDQFKLRTERLGLLEKYGQNLSKKLLLKEGDCVEALLETIEAHKPQVVVCDSISTYRSEEMDNPVGGQLQIKHVANVLHDDAHKKGYVVFIVGHENKDGSISGPQYAQHVVDTVIHAELLSTLGNGDKVIQLECPKKNRFGKTGVKAIFVMSEKNGILIPQDPDDEHTFVVQRKTKLTD